MKRVLIVVNGTARAGKDSFVEFVSSVMEEHGICSSLVSSVDNVKEAAKLLGWDGTKDELGRKFLSDLKDMSTSYYDGPTKYMLSRIGSCKCQVMFFMIREPEEIHKFVKITGAKTVVIRRHSAEAMSYCNHADLNVLEYVYDDEIMNDAGIPELSAKARIYANNIIKEVFSSNIES